MNTQAVEGYRLSPQQQYLWTLQKALQECPQTVSAALVLDGILDAELIRRVLLEVVRRHEILRTVFTRMGALQFPVQVIRPSADLWLPTLELNEAVALPWLEGLDNIYKEFRNRKWDLQNGPLLQAQLVRLGASRSAVLIRISSLCSDKTGLRNVINEMLQIVSGGSQETAGPPQYADIAEYLSATLESDEAALGRQFWDQWKRDLFPHLWPAGDAHTTSAGEECLLRWNLDSQSTRKIQKLAEITGADVADVLLACWQLVLCRYFQQDKFTIGIVCGGRQLEGLDGVPGVFERILPVSCRILPSQRFTEFVQNVAQTRSQINQWQDYFSYSEFEDKFISAGVAFECDTLPSLPAHGPAIVYSRTDESLYPHQLKLLCSWNSESPVLQIGCQRSTLSEADASALRDQFDTLLMNAAESPSEAIEKLSTLSSTVRNFLLYELNKTETPYPITYAHVGFQAQARRTPHQPAIVAGDVTLTYRELDQKSARLAAVLNSRGIGPERVVVICMERCPELLISLLAVLKAGGYYVPLDAHYPAERLAFVLRDSKAALILTKSSSKSLLSASDVPILSLDDDWCVPETIPGPMPQLHPHNLAYTIYTSGSTGQPKGVAVTHAALSNYLAWCAQHYDLGKGQGVIVHSPAGFDLTVTTLLAPLWAGQKIILLPEEDPTENLARLLRKDAQFTLIKVTPAHLQVLNQIVGPQELAGAVRTVIIGGEALFNHHVELWRAESPQTRLINEYGPTETTVGCSTFEIPAAHATPGPVPIGKPIANAKLYVLDFNMQPVPFKTTGELYIGGAGLARGYLGQVELTAARFIPDPFSARPGARLYKTGDLARYNADGTLEFLGRADDQIKVRGYRIELGEIEHALRQHALVRDAAVILKDRGQQKQLVAYIAVLSPDEFTGANLHTFLSGKLPEYMVPAHIVPLDHLPLTRHGKVDKKSLPDPDVQAVSRKREYVAPRSATEEILADLWAKALPLEKIGIYDDFFELGGDSIIGIQIVNRAKQRGITFTPRQLFRHRTIAELAAVVETTPAISAGDAKLRQDSPPAQPSVPSTVDLSLTQLGSRDLDRLVAQLSRSEDPDE